jgi:DNA-binding transcriptional LysR family regulator
MALELRQMRYFAAVAEEGQLTRAARRLSMAQPALSQAIAQLEIQVGVKLLERHARGITLTPAGAAFLEKARATIAAAAEAEQLASSWARGQTGHLTLGFLSLMPTGPGRDLVAALEMVRPDVLIQWRELGFPAPDPHAWLDGVDAALTFVPPEVPGIEVQPLAEYPLAVVTAAHHRLATATELRVADVIDETFCGFDGSASQDWIGFWTLDRYRGGPPRKTTTLAVTPEETTAMVASGQAISVTPTVVAAPFESAALVSIPLIDASPAVLALIWRPSRNPLVQTLASVARTLTSSGAPRGA